MVTNNVHKNSFFFEFFFLKKKMKKKIIGKMFNLDLI
jgi:hypothetical protein